MLNLAAAALAFVLSFGFLLAGVSRVGAFLIERRNPPVGAFAEVAGTRMHFVHVPAPARPALPPLVFIHGASGNLKDQMVPLRPFLEGKAEMLFVDRPGHGWSARGGQENATPSGQARTIAALMDRLAIGKAIIVGHSFGGAVTGALALERPDKVAGLVFLSAASHPWPGKKTSWYYPLAAHPLFGRIFSNTVALPAGLMRMPATIGCVFSPNAAPADYIRAGSIDLVLRPANFRYNAQDVEGLYDHVSAAAPRYGEIAVPVVVVSGDSDTVVYEEIHSLGLKRDIPGAELVWIGNLGHKPDYAAPEVVVAAIGRVAGAPAAEFGDLKALALAAERRLSGDDHGPYAACRDTKPAVPEGGDAGKG